MANDANERLFSMRETGDVSYEVYSGEFKVKARLGHRDHLRKDQLRRDLLGGQPGVPTERALTTSSMIAEVAIRVVDGPKWWKESNNGLDLVDDNVLRVVWENCMRIEEELIEEKRKEAEAAKQALRDELKAEMEAEEALSVPKAAIKKTK